VTAAKRKYITVAKRKYVTVFSGSSTKLDLAVAAGSGGYGVRVGHGVTVANDRRIAHPNAY
jgi:hypothetical protein